MPKDLQQGCFPDYNPLEALKRSSSLNFFEKPTSRLREIKLQFITWPLDLFACPKLKLLSKPGETEGDFTARMSQVLRERRDTEVDKLKGKYGTRLQALTDRVRRAEERVEREKAQASQQQLSTALGVGATLLGALMGRRMVSGGTVGRATSTMRSAGKIGKEKADVRRAGESLEDLKQRLQELEGQFEAEVAEEDGKKS